jgi:hypothetical protein
MDGSPGSPGCEDATGAVIGNPVEEIASSAGDGEWDRTEGTEEEPTVPQPLRAGGDSVDNGCSGVTDETLAQLPFLKPTGLDSAEGTAGARVAVVDAVNGFAILTPAAAAILRSSFSSRFRSFSFRLSCSSGVFCLARWVVCMSRKRILWWCAYELVCSSYWATFWNCLSQTVQ